jgi:hypothetical protein
VLLVITVLGETLTPDHRRRPPWGRRGYGQVQRRDPGASEKTGRAWPIGMRHVILPDRPSNTRPAPPTTGSSSMDQGVGRSVWVPYSSGKRARPRTCHSSVTRTGKQEDS